MAQSRKATKIQKKLSMLLYGQEGTRKSSIAAEAIALKNHDGKPMKVLFIDAEFGGLDNALEIKAEQYGVDLENSYLIYTESYREVMDILEKVRKKEDLYYYEEDGSESDEVVLDADGNPFRPDFIVIDGSTIIYDASAIALTKFSERRARLKAKAAGKTSEEVTVAAQNSQLELRDYNRLNKEFSQEFALKLISTGCHHIVTAREVEEKQQVKDSEGKISSIGTGKFIPSGFKGLAYNLGTVVRLIEDEMGEIKGVIGRKDRTNTFAQNEILEEPSLLMWQDYVYANAGRKSIELNPTFSDAISKELEHEIEANGIKKEDVAKELTPAEYHLAIKEQLESLKPEVKKAAGAKIKAAGLTLKYTEITDIAKLKQFMEIISQ